MALFYDRDGEWISAEKHTNYINDTFYCAVANTRCNNGCIIKTIWHGFGIGPNGPLIFQTIVTHPNSEDTEIYNYAYEEEAMKHHQLLRENEITYLGKENPTRWEAMMWEIEDND